MKQTFFFASVAMAIHCNRNSITLALYGIDISAGIVFPMMPLFGRVNRLFILWVSSSKFLRSIFHHGRHRFVSWNPWRGTWHARAFVRHFPNWNRFGLLIWNLENSDIAEFLKQNPQLQRIEIRSCEKLDGRVFKLIAKYVAGFEEIYFYSFSVHVTSIEYDGHLRKLKSLTLLPDGADHKSSYTSSAVRKIGSLNIALPFRQDSGVYWKSFENAEENVVFARHTQYDRNPSNWNV